MMGLRTSRAKLPDPTRHIHPVAHTREPSGGHGRRDSQPSALEQQRVQTGRDPAMKDWSSFMDKYYPDGDKDDGGAIFGYAAAETLFQVLTQCGDDLSRENVMRQATSLKNYRISVALPGITLSTGPEDFRPIEQMRLVQFDGNTWQPIGDVLDSAFSGTADK